MFSLMMLTCLLKCNARIFKKTTALLSTTHKWTQYNHMIRPATKDDINRIDNCNRVNLPENYYNDFYEEHIHRFPELQLIALNEKQELMGYAMGRVEILRETIPTFDFNKYEHPAQYTGHVVSVALNAPYRGMGVAQTLMQHLHSNLAEYYGMDRVNLFCRASNREAIKLYQDHLHYQLDRTVSSYYIDGEDALLFSLNGLVGRWEKLTTQQRETVRTTNNCGLTWQLQQQCPAKSAAQDLSIITAKAMHTLPTDDTLVQSGLPYASSMTNSSKTTTPKLLL